MTLKIDLPDRRWIRMVLSDRRFDFREKPRTIDKMPESVRKAFRESADKTNGYPWEGKRKPPP